MSHLDPLNTDDPFVGQPDEEESLSPCACQQPDCLIDGNDSSNINVNGRWYARACGEHLQSVVEDLARSHRADIQDDEFDQVRR